jgi:undecaprenyl-diphosphatase
MEHLWHIVLLGIVEGITEFLPISSTGHLLIAEHWLGAQSDFFNIFIQAGAVSAVVLIYWRRLLTLATGWNEPENRDYLIKLVAAFAVSAALGLVVKHFHVKLPEEITPVAWALIIGGLAILAVEQFHGGQGALEITWTVAIAVGLAQIVAGVFPGTSRSAATILAAMLLGLSRPAATEFSFLLGIPTMYAASALEFKKQWKEGPIPSHEWTDLLVGFAVSAVVAFIAVKWLLSFIRNHKFTPFAWYRLVLGVALLVFLR